MGWDKERRSLVFAQNHRIFWVGGIYKDHQDQVVSEWVKWMNHHMVIEPANLVMLAPCSNQLS